MNLPRWWCRRRKHTGAPLLFLREDDTWAECQRCGDLFDHGPWCPEFIPWSCYDIVDPDFDSCDRCACPKAMHPVRTLADERNRRPLPEPAPQEPEIK